MKLLTRYFRVSPETATLFAFRGRGSIMFCVNRQKLGKHRRGSVAFVGFEASCHPQDSFVKLTFEACQSPHYRIDGYAFQRQGYADFGKVLRGLADHQRRFLASQQ